MSNFIARFFSTDDFDKHPENTQSKFTVTLNKPLELIGEWEVGIVQIGLNKTINNKTEFENEQGKDALSCTKLEKEMVFDKFVRNLIVCTTHPEIYRHKYFSEYLNDKIYYTHSELLRIFEKDHITMFNVDTVDKISFIKIDIHDTLFPSEMKLRHLSPLFDTFNISDSEGRIPPIKVHYRTDKSVTLSAFLYSTLRALLKTLHGNHDFGNDDLLMSINVKAIEKKIGKDALSIQDQRRQLLDAINFLAHEMVHAFVDVIKKSREVVEEIATKPFKNDHVKLHQGPWSPKFFFVYSDIIVPQIVGTSTFRTLLMAPFKMLHNEFHHNIDYIQYCKVEKSIITEISFIMVDENGDEITFVNHADEPNFIGLHFRKIQ